MRFFTIQEVGENKICTTIIVACESKFGAKKKELSKAHIKTGNYLGEY